MLLSTDSWLKEFPRKLSIKLVLIPKQGAPLEKRDKPDIAFGNGRRFVDLFWESGYELLLRRQWKLPVKVLIWVHWGSKWQGIILSLFPSGAPCFGIKIILGETPDR